jgi:hypothetical protein
MTAARTNSVGMIFAKIDATRMLATSYREYPTISQPDRMNLMRALCFFVTIIVGFCLILSAAASTRDEPDRSIEASRLSLMEPAGQDRLDRPEPLLR